MLTREEHTLKLLIRLAQSHINEIDCLEPLVSDNKDAHGRPQIDAGSTIGEVIGFLRTEYGLVLSYASPEVFLPEAEMLNKNYPIRELCT